MVEGWLVVICFELIFRGFEGRARGLRVLEYRVEFGSKWFVDLVERIVVGVSLFFLVIDLERGREGGCVE